MGQKSLLTLFLLQSFFVIANEISDPVELLVEFRNISKKYVSIISYNEKLYALKVRTRSTIDSVKFPILFKTTKNCSVPLFSIALFESINNLTGSPKFVAYSKPTLSIIKVANKSGAPFVPSYLPTILIETFSNSCFPLKFCCIEPEGRMNYIISFNEK